MSLSTTKPGLNEMRLRADLEADPESVVKLTLLASHLCGLQRFGEAERLLRRAHELQPGRPDVMLNLALVLIDQLRDFEAENWLQGVLSMHPNLPIANKVLGWLLANNIRLAEAEPYLLTALDAEPDCVQTVVALTDVYQYQHRFVEAEPLLRHAAAANPQAHECAGRFGTVLIFNGKYEEAEAVIRRTLDAAPEDQASHEILAKLLLTLGRWNEGWAHYEWRLAPITEARRSFDRPKRTENLPVRTWRGEPLDGKSLLISTEQGLGDNIQFIRYVAELKSLYRVHVTLRCFDALVPLFQNVAGIDALIKSSDSDQVHARPYEYDFDCFLLSLPFHLVNHHSMPLARVPYIGLPDGTTRHWAGIVKQRSNAGKIKVGLVWGGSPTLNHWKAQAAALSPDAVRSVAVTALLPLLVLPQFDFFSLQMGPPREQLAELPVELRPIDLMDGVKDFVETGAIIESLDLVISVDTSVAHLAGALNKPVWLLNRLHGDWRWMFDREDSPWYPSMRIFRQTRVKEWDAVIQRVAQALIKLAGDEAKPLSFA